MIEFWAGAIFGIGLWSILNMLKEVWQISRMDKMIDRDILGRLATEKKEGKHDDDEGRD